MDSIREIAFAVLLLWSSWCVVSPKINDGIIGKLFFMLVALGSVSALMGSDCAPTWVYVGVCLVFVRAWFLVQVWPHVVTYYKRHRVI
jgi:hypothetical protein